MTNKIKRFSCKICRARGKEFSSTRHEVRLHLRKEHMIRGKLKVDNKIMESMLTANTIVEDWE